MILSAGGKSPGHRKPKNGPLPALNTPVTPRCCHFTHTHTDTQDTITRQAFHNCLDLGDSCCIPAMSECANVCVCVSVWFAALACAYVPLISQWRGGDILSDRPFKHTLPLHTGDFSPLQETSPKTNNSHASFLKRNNAGKERRTNPVKRAVSIRKTKIYQKNIHTRKYADIYIYLFFFGNVIQLDMHSFLCAARV